MTGPAQIRRQDVIEDIRALVEVMGLSITEAIGTAVTAQLATERGKAATKTSSRRKRAEAALADLRSFPWWGRKYPMTICTVLTGCAVKLAVAASAILVVLFDEPDSEIYL